MGIPHEPYFYNYSGVNPRFVGGTHIWGMEPVRTLQITE